MTRFKQLTVKGFRRLFDIDIALRPLTVMIGVNGVGKSSFLEALTLLAASANGELKGKISQLGGLSSLLTVDKAKRLELGVVVDAMEEDAEYLGYELRLSQSGTGYGIDHESLVMGPDFQPPLIRYIESTLNSVHYRSFATDRVSGQETMIAPTWSYDHAESALSQVPRDLSEAEALRRDLSSAKLYHGLDVGPRSAVRLPQTMQPADLPGADGETLVSCLYYLRETDRSRFEAIEDALHAAFPSFERLEFPPVAAGTLAMAWRDQSFTKPLYTHQLSEGTLRFLWLVTLLQSPGLPSICMIDEPEVSLHPEMLSLLADLLREASSRTLVVVATHSDRLIRFLEPEEVLVVDMQEDGNASATWADALNLDAWLDEYTLDEVWRMGRMGGR